MIRKIFPVLLAAIVLVTVNACRPSNPVPKPVGYFKVDFPEKKYQRFDSAGFPYSFEYPVYAKITQDAELVKQENSPYWINIYVPGLDATIYLSYKTITSEQPLAKLVEDSYRLSYAHDVKADYIKNPEFTTPYGLKGVFYNVGGNAASAYQFYATDETKNFVRASLYFNIAPNADSLKPAIEFMKKDMERLVNTLQFRR